MTPLNVALLSLTCTLLGVGISKIWVMASKYTAISSEIVQLREDQKREAEQALQQRNNIGDKTKQLELKLFYVAMMVSPEPKRQEILNALVRRLT